MEEFVLGPSQSIKKVWAEAQSVAPSDLSILLVGETGVGKEHLARIIHRQSSRASRPFVPLDCAALSPSLLESELFGHEKGAFTGAHYRKLGILEKTQGGTLFLDEVGDIELPLQVKFLRVLQEKAFRRVGGTKMLQVDFRLLAATNRDLKKMVKEGTFREDFYYRLKGLTIYLPPLRERREDILPLVKHYLDQYNQNYRKDLRLSDGAREVLLNYSWPGNVRELMHLMEALVVTVKGKIILPEQMPLEILTGDIRRKREEGKMLTLKEMEREHILKVLTKTGYNKKRTARLLGISLNTLKAKLRSCGVKI